RLENPVHFLRGGGKALFFARGKKIFHQLFFKSGGRFFRREGMLCCQTQKALYRDGHIGGGGQGFGICGRQQFCRLQVLNGGGQRRVEKVFMRGCVFQDKIMQREHHVHE